MYLIISAREPGMDWLVARDSMHARQHAVMEKVEYYDIMHPLS